MNALPTLAQASDRRLLLPDKNSTTKEIPLTQGRVALIDEVDYERVSRHSWHLHAANRTNTKSYARARINGKMTLLHRYILSVAPDKVTDHRNRDGLDCRRQNLRVCTRSQNACNVSVRRNNKVGYKGVYQTKDGKFTAMLRIKDATRPPRFKRDYYGGTFSDPESAARAYDALAVEYHQDFAGLNFPNEKPDPLQKRVYNWRLLTFNGKTQLLPDWAREQGISVSGLRRRIRQGWSIQRALTTPVKTAD